MASRGPRISTRLAIDGDRAALGRGDAEEGESDVGATGADEPGEADDLAGANLEAHIFERAGATEALDAQHGRTGLVTRAHEEVVDVPADHLAYEQLVVRLGDKACGDVPAVAEHGDAIGDAEHLVETVADEQHGDAAPTQLADLVEQPVDLVRRQRRRRFVHDQHSGVEGDRLGDLDGLLRCDGERVGRSTGVDVDVERAQDRCRPRRTSAASARRGRAGDGR